MNSQELIKILVCPKCKGGLHILEKDTECGFGCASCQLVYPVQNGIPIMLIEKAIPEKKWFIAPGDEQCES